MLRRLPLAGLIAAACAPGSAASTTDTGSTTDLAVTTSSTGRAVGSSSDGTAAGTSGTTTTTTGGVPLPEPGPDEVLEVFSGAHVYFGERNMRQIDAQVEFPAPELAYESVRIGIVLGCPNDLCDWWDRYGYVAVVEDAGTDDERVLEIARFITPYRVGATWILDVTHLRPLLSGSRTVRVFIDTWVGPGHPNGDGWLADVSFQFLGGIPERMPIAVVELWDERGVEYGNPDAPVEDAVPSVTVEVPPEATYVELRSLITGHGQGNLDNCAEFCPRTHGFSVDDLVVSRSVWRDDCNQTPVSGQQGTWTLSRAGWCPGAEVLPWIEDVTAAVIDSTSVTVGYDVEDYVNTCSPQSLVCKGCALGTGCDYDGGNHTTPSYRLDAQLVAYRDLQP